MKKPIQKSDKPMEEKKEHAPTDEIRLNKYISNSGVCSRREADKLIEQGKVSVNGKKATELGMKVQFKDKVKVEGKEIQPEKLVYVLLNKPKDFITTMSDEKDRKTVMQLVQKACPQRIYPVGRLDRNTTGLLLFTNDGDLAKKLSHPSFNVKKMYEVTLDRPLAEEDFIAIRNGVKLDDGMAKVDNVAISVEGDHIVGVELHIGKNRIVRRIFEHFGYLVERLDRVTYAGLTKKDLPRGKWRILTPKEVVHLKHFMT